MVLGGLRIDFAMPFSNSFGLCNFVIGARTLEVHAFAATGVAEKLLNRPCEDMIAAETKFTILIKFTMRLCNETF
eukprot:3516146-Amphidinium_carterae.1